MEQLELLRHVARVMEELGLRYLATASTALNQPRPGNTLRTAEELRRHGAKLHQMELDAARG